MINPKERVLDRIEQSFNLFTKNKDNFLKLVLPLFTYKLVFTILIWDFISYWLLWNLDLQKTDIFSSSYYLVIFFFIIVWFLLYLTFLVWFLLYSIKSVKDIYEWKNIDLKSNLKYGVDSIIPSFNTYWYIFEYIAIIPSIFIIFGWILFLLWVWDLWVIIMLFWFFLLFVFMIYRWVKTSFSLYSAVDYNHYTKSNFRASVKITNWNWWRIVWNFLLLTIFSSIILWIIGWVLSIFSTGIFDVIDTKWLIEWYFTNSISPSDVDNVKKSIMDYYNTFYFNNFLISIINLFLDNIKEIFFIIFTFVFYKRLKFEKTWKIDTNVKEKTEDNEQKKEIEL